MGKVITQKELNELLSSNRDFGLGDDYCPTYEEINGAWRDHKIIVNDKSGTSLTVTIGALDSETGQIYKVTTNKSSNNEILISSLVDIDGSSSIYGRYLKKFYLYFNNSIGSFYRIRLEYNGISDEIACHSSGDRSFYVPLGSTNTIGSSTPGGSLFYLKELSDNNLMSDIVITILNEYLVDTTISDVTYSSRSSIDGSLRLIGSETTSGKTLLSGTQSAAKLLNGTSTSITPSGPIILNQIPNWVVANGSAQTGTDEINVKSIYSNPPDGSIALVASAIVNTNWGHIGIYNVWDGILEYETDKFPSGDGIINLYNSGSTTIRQSVSLNGKSGSLMISDYENTNSIGYSTQNSSTPYIFTVYRKLGGGTGSPYSVLFKSSIMSSNSTGSVILNIGRPFLYKFSFTLPEKCMVRFRRGFYFSGTSYMSTTVGLTATVNSSQTQTIIYNNNAPYFREATLYDAANSFSSSVRVTVKSNANLITSSSVTRYAKIVYIDYNNNISTIGNYATLSSSSSSALISMVRSGGLPLKAVSVDLFTSTSYLNNDYGSAVVLDMTELSARNTTNYCRIFTNSSSYQLYFYLDGTMNPMWLGSTTANTLSTSACSIYLPSGVVADYELYDSRSTPYRTGTINGSGTFGVLKDSSYSSGNIRIKLKDVKEDTSPLTITLTDASLSLKSDYEISVNYHLSRLTTVRDVRADVEVYDSATSEVLYTNAITIPAYSNGDKTHLIEGFSVEEFDKYATGGNSLGVKLKPNSTNPDYVTIDSTPKVADFVKYTNLIYYDVIDDTHISMSIGYYEFSIASTYPVRSNISITGVYSVDYETRSGESYSTEVSVPFSIPSGSHTSSTVKVTTNSISFDYTPYRINSCSWLEFRNLNIQSDTWFNYDY